MSRLMMPHCRLKKTWHFVKATPRHLNCRSMEKICGLTIRQFKTNWLIQGILHAQPTHPVFYPWIPDAQHLDLQLDSAHIQQTLIQALKLSII